MEGGTGSEPKRTYSSSQDDDIEVGRGEEFLADVFAKVADTGDGNGLARGRHDSCLLHVATPRIIKQVVKSWTR